MYLTSEQKLMGRRNFWRIAGQGVDLSRLKLETCVPGPLPGGPVRGGIVGVGRQGLNMLKHSYRDCIDLQAICDINPDNLAHARQMIISMGGQAPREYTSWEEMAAKEKLEVVIVATPLWNHAPTTIGLLEAGINVLSEKMMAYDVSSCQRMIEASRMHHKLLEIGYPRFYEPLYQALYKNMIQPKLLGDISYVRLHTHRNSNWRWDGKAPSGTYDASKWGYPTWEDLANWRMYNHYSRGLVGELGSHQTSLAEWFLGSSAQSVYGTGGIYRYRDGRQVDDHIFMTFEHPGNCTVELSVILSNSYGGLYEEFVGSKGTLIVSDTDGGMFFPTEGGYVDLPPIPGTDETKVWSANWDVAFRTEVWAFCSAVKRGTPLLCGPERAMTSAAVALAGYEALDTRTRVDINLPAMAMHES